MGKLILPPHLQAAHKAEKFKGRHGNVLFGEVNKGSGKERMIPKEDPIDPKDMPMPRVRVNPIRAKPPSDRQKFDKNWDRIDWKA